MKTNTQVIIGIVSMSIAFMAFCLIASCNTDENPRVSYDYAVEYWIPDSLKRESREWITKTIAAMPSKTESSIYDVENLANEKFGIRTEGLQIFRNYRLEFVPHFLLNPKELQIMNELKNKERIVK